jgi:hypothetical protein
VLKSRQENTHRQWELEVNALQQNTERDITKLNETIDGYQQEIAAIETKINNSKDSFYGWLNQNYPGWENTIGKVCDENLLFQNDLSPQRFADAAQSFYGVQLNLKDIQKTVKTVADYENEKLQLLVRIELNKKKVQGYTDKQNEELEKLKRKYQPKLKEFKDGVAEHEYNIEQSHTKLDQAKLNKKDFELKAQTEKQSALQQIDAQIDAANETYLLAKQAQQGIEDNLQKQLKSKEREYDKKVAAEEENLNSQLQLLEQDLNQYETTYQQQKQQLAAQRNDELSGKGADTQKLTGIEKELAALQTELNFIEKHRDMVAEYNKDKRELLDKTDSFKNKKQLLEQQLENDEQKQQQHIQALKHEVKEIDQSIAAIRSDIQKAKEDIDAFADFQLSECYASIAPAHKEAKDEYKTDKRTKTLVEELSRCYYNAIKRLDELKEAVNKFLSNFSAHNLFNFTTGLIARQQYLDFAEQLNEFVADNKIEEFEKRINERFATIIHSLGKETSNLMSKGDEIQKVISNINKDFDRKNFVGAIKKIELRLDESANNIVRLLLLIKQFNDDNAYDIGGLNLFSSQDSETKNKKAVDLLKQLSKAISEYKKDYISLSDSFELKFRIEENQNDTGWVEKLANVGSEGTDVLVKAMINIMLLNVFKEGASKRFKEFRLHCMMDEIGKLHPNNVKGILQFANDRNILLINGSPTETNAMDYRHIYKLEKDAKSFTKVKRIISNYA